MPAKKQLRRAFPLPLLLALIVVIALAVYFFTYIPTLPFLKSSPSTSTATSSSTRQYRAIFPLPAVTKQSRVSVEQAIAQRKVRTNFTEKTLTLKQLSQIVWAMQGVTVDWGDRTVPSVHSVYPLSIYVEVNHVTDLPSGIYEYIPGDLKPIHQLGQIKVGDFHSPLEAASNLSSTKDAPLVILITANFKKMAQSFNGVPHDDDVFLEAGMVTQNLALQLETLGLGTVATKNFDAAKISSLIELPSGESLIYLLPIGYPKE